MSLQLSETVKELIAKSRIVSFSTWQTAYPTEVIARFQAADDEGRYLTDDDLHYIAEHSPETSSLIAIARLLRDHVNDIVAHARVQVLTDFPDITQPGGGLYPAERADACWRDFWHFLRCITYGIAAQNPQYTSESGLHSMQLLYRELHVPLDAMVVGLKGIKTASLMQVEPDQQATLHPYFDHLIVQLQSFQ
jgi:Phycobilisome protein